MVVDNVVIDGTVYTINDDGTNGAAIIVSNSTLNGWTSWTKGHREVTFTNCSFGESSGYKFLQAYQSATFKDCDFAAGYKVNPANESTYLTFENCTYGGEKITVANVADIFYAPADAGFGIVK